MTELEKAMRRRYEYNHLGLTSKRDEKDLIELQKWAEKLILKKKGKLTILDENEIKQVMDKLRAEQLL